MTHEQKPGSAALDRVKAYICSRTEKPIQQMGDGIHEVHLGDAFEASLTMPDLMAVAKMAEQRRKDAEIDRDRLADLIEGMDVSVDVSTCDEDAGHRLFGTVTVVQEYDSAKNGLILLVQEPEPNFEQRREDAEGADPVTWQRNNPGYGWIDTPKSDVPHYEARGFAIRALYTRPANVAAIEARVMELEGVAKAALEWIDAVPDEERASFPTMPGFDRDWADCVIADIREGGEHG